MYNTKKTSTWFGNFLWYFVILIYFFLVRSSPLLGTFGFESANLFILIFAPFFAFWASSNNQTSFIEKVIHKYALALSYVLFLSLLFFANSFFYKSCSQSEGILAFLYMLIPAIFCNILLGVFTSFIINKYIKNSLIIIFYLSYYVYHIYFWYTNPSFRIYTHLSVLIPSDLVAGSIFDPYIFQFKFSSLLFCISFISFISFLKNKKSYIFLSIFLFIAGFFIEENALKFLQKTTNELKNDYSLIINKNYITIKANPSFTSLNKAQDILHEALFWQKRLERKLGIISNKNLTIWLHENDKQKFIYTGAKNVHFALPNKREIHISGSNTPHHVLGHELAHIYAGEYSMHFLKMIGENFIIPNLALTEGIAMYLSSEENIHADLTMFEQTASLYQIGIKVDIDDLFSSFNTKFINTNPHVAYLYAGSFLEFIFNQSLEPQKLLQKIISTGSLKKSLNKENFDQLKKEFFIKLENPLPSYAHDWAKNNFIGQSILTQNCLSGKLKTVYEKSNFELLNEYLIENNYNKAKDIIKKINKNTITPYEKRKIIIIETCLQKNLEHNNTAKNIINFIANNNYYYKNSLKLSFMQTINNDKLDIINNYLLAKINTNEENYVEALDLINNVINQKELLEEELIKEALLLQAKLYLKINDNNQANTVLNSILNLYSNNYWHIIINDYLERSIYTH